MLYFSKSRYCEFCQCPKMAWLRKHKPEMLVIDANTEAKFAAGNEIGDLAMGYFGDFTEVTAYQNEKINLSEMIENTKREIEKNTSVICEASFDFDGLYCAVDILRRENNGWSIYEVKSGTHADKDIYMTDIAYQKYVLEHCGISVIGTYLMCIDSNYVFDGKLDIHKLFKITDVSEKVALKMPEVETNLKLAEQIVNSETEPDTDIGLHCSTPYDCNFWAYCTRNLPKPNVFDLYRIQKKTSFALYQKGIISYANLEKEKSIKNPIQKMQIAYALSTKAPHIDRENLKNFLSELTYPLYFLDFETVQTAVPKYTGTKPYMQIPFQYSLHYLETENAELKHKEFLAESGTDPRRMIAESLCRDIPENVTVIAYNKSFECGRLKELAGYFPDLSAHLLNIQEHMKDIMIPFRNGWYYNEKMGGNFSLKSILPALFPDNPELNYHNLEGVHNGGEAMTIFPAMEKMSPEEQAEARKNLLQYCCLDTLATVRIWEVLKEAVK